MKSSKSTKPPTKLNVGIVGATGMVGETFLQLLTERQFPVTSIRLFASQQSQGKTREFGGQTIELETLKPDCFRAVDLVFFSSGDPISREWAPQAVNAGAVVVDNSGAFRMDPDKLLIVPEINGHLLPRAGTPTLIANPNCSTIQLLLALAPLSKDFGLESVHVATYQAVSGAGREGQEELATQLQNWRPGSPIAHRDPPTFPHPIAMNCIPQIGSISENGFCTEEIKIMAESKKILGQPNLRISAFAVRVPVWNGHSEAVWVRLKQQVSRSQIATSLARQPGLKVEDNPKESMYPLALNWSGKDPVAVGRIHQDLDDPQTWILWIVGDNLRKGAALNGIQIAERIFDISPAP